MKSNHWKLAALCIAAVTAATVMTGGSATAATFAPNPGPTVATQPLTVLGYDEEVASANGFEIVTYPDGS
ncbi:hypothetical protein ABCS02_20010 [Microbacterium sp. X-17]|uniref:hypothetical protein n=1 Tax=Microbacterium sp. X-17 TaxID=3144404 RepID=UPI0031F56AAA